IQFYNQGTITLQDLTGLGWSLRNDGGLIEIGMSGTQQLDLTVNDPIVGSGAITLEATGSIHVNADITSNVRVTLEADEDGDNSGAIDTSNGAVVAAPQLVVLAAT